MSIPCSSPVVLPTGLEAEVPSQVSPVTRDFWTHPLTAGTSRSTLSASQAHENVMTMISMMDVTDDVLERLHITGDVVLAMYFFLRMVPASQVAIRAALGASSDADACGAYIADLAALTLHAVQIDRQSTTAYVQTCRRMWLEQYM
jgi:hypothetical protein